MCIEMLVGKGKGKKISSFWNTVSNGTSTAGIQKKPLCGDVYSLSAKNERQLRMRTEKTILRTMNVKVSDVKNIFSRF